MRWASWRDAAPEGFAVKRLHNEMNMILLNAEVNDLEALAR
ncbi:hypothetical protein AKJ09_06003 [Labilithrix luteola]|uniref:Uncharacterized protein n=1 Tax=Labilithrix luteola TaxID=1391654 RepID=A0A0K1Q1S2_9BACT|nr:hypothetical protein AKJ09_06003 [Labilithrix luteola]